MLLSEIQYFDKKAYQYVTQQNSMSRETLIFITPEQFLKLAHPGHDSNKEQNVEKIIDSGEKLRETPLLGCETDNNGDLVVRGNGMDHEGRHRARALQKRGVKLIPVRIISSESGGPAFRWGSTERRPSKLIGFRGYSILFPKTFPHKSKVD